MAPADVWVFLTGAISQNLSSIILISDTYPLTTENLVSRNNAEFFNKVVIVRKWNSNVFAGVLSFHCISQHTTYQSVCSSVVF